MWSVIFPFGDILSVPLGTLRTTTVLVTSNERPTSNVRRVEIEECLISKLTLHIGGGCSRCYLLVFFHTLADLFSFLCMSLWFSVQNGQKLCSPIKRTARLFKIHVHKNIENRETSYTHQRVFSKRDILDVFEITAHKNSETIRFQELPKWGAFLLL